MLDEFLLSLLTLWSDGKTHLKLKCPNVDHQTGEFRDRRLLFSQEEVDKLKGQMAATQGKRREHVEYLGLAPESLDEGHHGNS